MENIIEWPLSEGDIQRPKVLLQRLTDWKRSIDLLTAVLRDVAAAEAASGRAMAKVSKMLDVDTQEFGLIAEPLAALKSLFERAADNHAATAQTLEEQSLRRLVDFRQVLSKESRRFKAVLDTQTAPLQRERAATVAAINAHTKTYQKALSGVTSAGDPWLSESRLKQRLTREIDEENSFKHYIAALYGDMKSINSTAAQVGIGAMMDLATAKRVQMLDSKECIDELVRTGLAASGPLDKPAHINADDRKDEAKFLALSRADEVEYPFRHADLSQIVKVGILKAIKASGLPLKSVDSNGEIVAHPDIPLLTSGLWRTYYVALTESGYLHCFLPDDPTLSDPVMTVSMKEADLSVYQDAKDASEDDSDANLCFSLSFPVGTSSFFTQRELYLLRTLSSVDLVEWMAALHMYMRRTGSGTNTPKPAYKPSKVKSVPKLPQTVEPPNESDSSFDLSSAGQPAPPLAQRAPQTSGAAQAANVVQVNGTHGKSRASSVVPDIMVTVRLRSFSFPSTYQNVKAGYLHKLTVTPQNTKVWQRRFFVAKVASLAYYENDKKARKDIQRRDVPMDDLICHSIVASAAEQPFVLKRKAQQTNSQSSSRAPSRNSEKASIDNTNDLGGLFDDELGLGPAASKRSSVTSPTSKASPDHSSGNLPAPPTSFCFRLSTGSGAYLLCASSLHERQLWMETIQVVAAVHARHKARGPSAYIAPIPSFKKKR